jgi:methyl-accepting chemotaxis protein
MFVFVAAIIAIFVLEAKVVALNTVIEQQLTSARIAILRMELFTRSADDDGGVYVMELRHKQASDYLLSYRSDLTNLNAELASATALARNDEQRAAIADIHKALDGPHGYLQGNEDAFAIKAAGKTKAATLAYVNASVSPVIDAGERYRTNAKGLAEAATTEAAQLSAFARTLGIGAALGALIFGFGIATLISRSISRSVGATTLAVSEIVSEDIAALTLILKRLAGGDLTGRFASSRAPLKVTGNDEIGSLVKTYYALAAALGEMANQYTAATDNLRDLISGVAMTSKSLAAASDEASAAAKQSSSAVAQIAQSVEVVSSGAQDQASQIADTATAIEELSRTAEQIAQVATNQAESIALTTAALQKLDTSIGALSSQGTTLTTAAREASSEATTGQRCRKRNRHHDRPTQDRLNDSRHRHGKPRRALIASRRNRRRSKISPTKRICSLSMRRSKPLAPVSTGAALPLSPMKSGIWPNAVPSQPKKFPRF